jgi:glycosyltransferase involved in cell wall biosynthesis
MNSVDSIPPISIVIPSYNQGQFIGATIDSILAQDLFGIEILVMDGDSKDETVEVLRRYGDQIQWVSEKDRGQSHAINKGFARARSDILGFINSDDTYQPGTCAAVLEAFRQHPEADFVYGDFNYIDAEGCVLASCQTINFDYDILRYDYNFVCQPASFWRRSVIERIGPVAEDLYYLMDYEFYLRAAAAGMRFYHLRRILANLRLHKECKTVRGSFEARRKYMSVRSAILAPYSFQIHPPVVDHALHLAFKGALRVKSIWRYWIENGELKLQSNRKLMARVQAG